MSEEDLQSNRVTVTWGAGGPKTAEQRNAAQTLFIDALKLDPNVSLACDTAHISRKTAYQWKEKNAAFSNAWDDAVAWTQDTARSSIYRRGILGWEEKVVSNGQVVYEYDPLIDEEGNQQFDEKGKPLFKGGKPLLQRKYSDSLASLYAKANLPEYKDKPQQVEHTGKNGKPIEVVNVTRELLKQKLDAMNAKKPIKPDGEPS